MSTLGSLMSLLGDAGIKPYNEQQLTANRIQFGTTQNQTQLLALAELRRQQEAQQLARQYSQQDPGALLGGGGSVLGSLGAPAGPPGAAPMTQQQVLPGQPPGMPQVVPGGQDLSQFAAQGGPPQSVLGSLGPQPQAPTPQQRLLALARTNPDAARLVQQQMQGQEDAALKRQEQQLKMGTAVLGYVGQQAQGVTDQAGLETLQQDLVSKGLQQYAAQLPQYYSKEAMAPFIAKALDVKESLQQRLEARRLDVLTRGQDVELAKAQQTGGKVNYQTDAGGNIVVVPEYAPGGGPVQSRPVLGADGQPIKSLEGQKLTAEQQRHLQTVETGLRTHVDTLLQPLYAARDAIGRVEQAAEQPSTAGDLALITAFMQMIDPRTGVKDAEFRNAASGGGILDRIQGYLGKLKEGTWLDEDVRADFLQRTRKLYAQYDKDYGQVKQQYRELATRMGGNPDNVVLEAGSTVAKTPGATGPKVVTRAALQAENARRNAANRDAGRPEISNEQAEAMARQKGYEVR